MNLTKNIKIALLAGSVLLSTSSFAKNAEDRYVYFGTELGVSDPIVKGFKYEADDKTTDITLRNSKMLGGRIGYAFYPGMMVELSWTHQPKFKLGYLLPAFDLSRSVPGLVIPGFGIPRTPGSTKVIGNVYTLNLVYEMQEMFAGIKPYVIAGAGFATIDVKPTTSTTDVFFGKIPGASDKVEFFKVKRTKKNYFATQLGGGLSRDITENFSVDLGAKIQIIKDVQINYDKLDIQTQEFKSQKPIKKTIGVGEYTLGFTFKLPV